MQNRTVCQMKRKAALHAAFFIAEVRNFPLGYFYLYGLSGMVLRNFDGGWVGHGTVQSEHLD
ncbi:conserved hypothetical protein [Roseibium sp. TrichSKD4]|nr:conserved hypothetical protein [Roseibium sp. TrichSKD4]